MTYTILLLDDDERFRKLVVPRLKAKDINVLEAGSGKQADDLAASNKIDALVIDGVLPDTDGITWLRKYRSSEPNKPVIYISAFWQSIDAYQVLTSELGVSQIVHKPVIPGVFAEQVAAELMRSQWTPSSNEQKDDPIALELEELSREYIESLPDEIRKIEEALEKAQDPNQRAQELQVTRLCSHKLRGTAGSFGLTSLGDLMGQMEDRIRSLNDVYENLDESFWSEMADIIATCRNIIEKNAGASPQKMAATTRVVSQQAAASQRALARILVVDDDPHFLDYVEKIVSQRLIEVVRASTPEEALQLLKQKSVDAIILDLNLARVKSFELAKDLRELPGVEHIPLAFVSSDASLDDRVQAAQLGASLYLNKPLDPDTLEDAVQRLLILGSREKPRILIVDDDKFFTKRAADILFDKGMEVHTLHEPSRILEQLHEVNPDLLLLDLLMPGISGFDICKMLRTIPRWQALPIVFVTAQTGLDTRIAAFTCGGDDYLAKPLSDEELVTRVSIRVERSRLFKERSERDAVTGLLVRRSFMERFTAQLSASRRQRQVVSLVMFDLDKFKDINDNHGHLAGDAVLAGLGHLLSKRFRVEDLRGRWGGDEFILALVGSEKTQSAMLMKAFLDEFTQMVFIGESGESFQTALSAGVAASPEDGQTPHELLQIADQRLYEAKTTGRNKVVYVGGSLEIAPK
ncbi:MAG: response regulator [Candidatus Obscuribacterales bacterium]|nr:response regulator [Candidatus Obscuribacterales bacterium]